MILFIYIIYIVEFLILITVFFMLLIIGFSLAPWVPSQKGDLERIHKLSRLKPGDTFCELGSGDARVCRYIAQKNPQAQVVGIELALPLYLWSKFKNLFSPYKNLTIKFGNALKYDLSQVDVVYVYALIATINQKLKRKFLQELKKGSRVVSYAFSIQNWPGHNFTDRPREKGGKIHVYEVDRSF